ncbi:MAG: DUF4157 domain-containing protein [Anaerolineae bacterium]|nr:DUF4157 domain-containing protein [Anaerolineae bacterium]
MTIDKLFQAKKSGGHPKLPSNEAETLPSKPNEMMEGYDLMTLQDQVGNHIVQAMLAQRRGDDPFELDDDTAGQINRERSGGQPLDGQARATLGGAMDQDFSGVKVHTSPAADQLSRQLGATAFTTGQDIFFRQGAYAPQSSSGQELLAHELTHVVQQSSGAVGGSNRAMTVNAPGDGYEQEADAVAQAITAPGSEARTTQMIARQANEEEIDTKLVSRRVDEDELPEEGEQ